VSDVKEDKILEHYEDARRWAKYSPEQINLLQEQLLREWLDRIEKRTAKIEQIKDQYPELKKVIPRNAFQRE
jgi:hypothetical protein